MADDPDGASALRRWIDANHPPPADVTIEIVRAWRKARRGATPAERQTNPLWTWLARNPEVTAYAVRKRFDLDDREGYPGWCAHRFGQSRTELPDGRVLVIGGEHEDGYDPDFFIYNDVWVITPAAPRAASDAEGLDDDDDDAARPIGADDTVEIHGYPPGVFPPTDFHTATLAGERVIVIGSIGYHRERGRRAQVLALDPATLAITRVETRGDDPGWLSKHTAALSADGASIVVRGGQREITVADATKFRENADEYALDLRTHAWRRLTARPWSMWELAPAAGHHAQLYLIGWLAGAAAQRDDWEREQYARHRARLGRLPDLALYAARYRPPVPHEVGPRACDEYDVHRVIVDGVTVRYVEKVGTVRVVIEGALPADVQAAIVEDVRHKLEVIEAMPYVATPLDA